MISSRSWEILVAFYQCKTLSAAADKLYVSQPALSAAMKQLEKELGVTLFNRTKNRIELNEVGLEAVRFAEAYLKQEKTLIQKLQRMSWRARNVTVAASVSELRNERVDKLTWIFHVRRVTSEQLSSELLAPGLLSERFDYVITEYPIEEPGVVCVPYVTDRLMVSVHKSDPLAQRDFLTFNDLQDENLIVLDDGGFWVDFIRREFSERMRLVFVQSEAEYLTLIQAFQLRSFISKTVVSQRKTPTDFRPIPLKEEGTEVMFYLCCLAKNDVYIPRLLERERGVG